MVGRFIDVATWETEFPGVSNHPNDRRIPLPSTDTTNYWRTSVFLVDSG